MKHAQNVRSELTNLCKDKQDVFPVAQTSPQSLMEQWKNQTVLVMSSKVSWFGFISGDILVFVSQKTFALKYSRKSNILYLTSVNGKMPVFVFTDS